MPTLSQWIACKDANGNALDLKTCNAYRSRYPDMSQAHASASSSRGLGDVVAKFTHATGIAKGVKYVAGLFGVDCGCTGRQETLNTVFPFKNSKKDSS